MRRHIGLTGEGDHAAFILVATICFASHRDGGKSLASTEMPGAPRALKDNCHD